MEHADTSRLPYELLLPILEGSTARLPARARTRRRAELESVCRSWYHPAKYLLYREPTLPARSVWLLSRTLRHDPPLALVVRALDVYSVVGSPLLLALLGVCKRLKDVRIKFISGDGTAWQKDWGGVLDLLETRGLDRLEWHGGDPKDLSRCFGWPTLRELVIHEHDFFGIESLLRCDAQP